MTDWVILILGLFFIEAIFAPIATIVATIVAAWRCDRNSDEK